MWPDRGLTAGADGWLTWRCAIGAGKVLRVKTVALVGLAATRLGVAAAARTNLCVVTDRVFDYRILRITGAPV